MAIHSGDYKLMVEKAVEFVEEMFDRVKFCKKILERKRTAKKVKEWKSYCAIESYYS